ncbi:MAG: DUF599 family protein [Ketobacter sp.]|nr:MAG: DUF599 family protein [Ketobacter sp.]
MQNIVLFDLSYADFLAFLWFLLCWVGYAQYAQWKALTKKCLASVLHQQRCRWMLEMLGRENRVMDASLIANLERNVSFFASSTLLILAGILTVLGATDRVISLAEELPFAVKATKVAWELKLFLLMAIFVYAFFKFSWALRQYGFASVVIGTAPSPAAVDGSARTEFSQGAGSVISRAAHAFNLGLRSYYFGLAFLLWFVNPWIFMATSTWVVAVLYRREFHSKALRALIRTNKAIIRGDVQ